LHLLRPGAAQRQPEPPATKPIGAPRDYAAAEVASVVARRVRTRALTDLEARASFDNPDQWTRKFAQPVEIAPAGIAMAAAFIRRLDLTLRAPDAIHMAIARRLGLAVATLGLEVAST
jgi:predicted nucleic acid-binding protein